MPTDTAPETTPDDTTADDAEGADYGDVLADLDELTDRIADLERDERKRLRTEESLRAAKNGLMAALAASTPREFVLACSQACSLFVAEAGAKSIAKSLRKTVQTFADATADLDPAMIVDLFESLGLKGEQLDVLRVAAEQVARAKGAAAPCGAGKCPGGPCPGGRCEAPAGGAAAPAEVVLRPVVSVSEYADRTEVRVACGCERKNVRLTKSALGYFVEAKTSAGITFRGPVTSFIAAHGDGVVTTWDEATCELVLTFPREAVEEVSIEAPETTPPAEV
jgi:hypothetical protein